ncbi:MAG: HEPN domain-containing protein [Elusimicrobiota bacterium]
MIKFQEYLNKGLLKTQNPNFKQIEKQIVRAEKDLCTFNLVIDNDPEWASTMVYQAMLRAGRSLLFSYGFLPADGQQHKTVIEITGKILGQKFGLLIKQFDRLRKKRNVFFYDSEDTHNFTEAKNAIVTARELINEVKRKINAFNPQQTFKL